MNCERCGAELVEVDNPLRREVRHKRGVVCVPRLPVSALDIPFRELSEHEIEEDREALANWLRRLHG